MLPAIKIKHASMLPAINIKHASMLPAINIKHASMFPAIKINGIGCPQGIFFIIEGRRLKFGALHVKSKKKNICFSDIFDSLHRKREVS